jgi:hypothetical protein
MRLMTGLWVVLSLCWPRIACGQQDAEWTVMVWMNGDNNLQDSIVNDWHEMAEVGSGANVNIVIQLDQSAKNDSYRFRLGSDEDFDPVLRSRDQIDEANMVSGDELADFIAWAKRTYPAKRYALIFSSHGTGWREWKVIEPGSPPTTPPIVVSSASVAPSATAAASLSANEEREEAAPSNEEPPTPPKFLPEGVFGSPNRAISNDDNSLGDALYNSELAEAVIRGMEGRQFDLIAFDACLMGMVEVAYGLRNAGCVLVASEELVSPAGYNYTDWLGRFRQNVSIDADALAKILVRSYDDIHILRLDQGRTLAAFDLERVGELTRAINWLSETLIERMDEERKAIGIARSRCTNYAYSGCDMGTKDCFFHIDLKRFVDELAALTKSEEVRAAAMRVSTVLKQARIDRYAGTERRGSYGSEGLAIYFPDTPQRFEFDHLASGAYFKSNRNFPVEFVTSTAWPDFLHVYHLGKREEVPQCATP